MFAYHGIGLRLSFWWVVWSCRNTKTGWYFNSLSICK